MAVEEENKELTEFVAVLEDLAGYKTYFEDEKNYQTLVDWLHEDTGISKLVLRTTLKYIAPLIISTLAKKAGDSAKGLYTAWMNKLHDKLGDYVWYRETCQRLLNSLKKRTDKSYGQMLDNPEVHSPQELLTHQGKWANLKDEQKAIVQLLIGQQKLDDSNQLMLNKILQFLDLFDYQPQLDSPEFLLESFQDPPPASARWLTYSSRQSDFVGRTREMRLLQDFLHSEPLFSWFCVTGAGGTGKSRLGLELMLATPWYWERGLLRSDELEEFKGDNWKPTHPTLFVVDYGAEVSTELKSLVDKLLRRQNDFDYPVRLLILERHYKQQVWWKTLFLEGREALIRQEHFFGTNPLELPPIGNKQEAILNSFLKKLGFEGSLAKTEHGSWQQIEALSEGGKPLFLGMIAIAIKDKGLNHVRDWKREELLNHLLVREQRSWQSQLAEFNEDKQHQIIELMLFCTLVQGVDLKRDKDKFKRAIEASGILLDLSQLPKYWEKVQQLNGQANGVLLPDVFAEFVLGHYWQFEVNGFNENKEKRIAAACLMAPEKTLEVISRCATDFYDKSFASDWWQYLWQQFKDAESFDGPQSRELTKQNFQQLCFKTGTNIVSQLSLAGHYSAALHNWLKPLSLVEPEKQKAEILNLIGKQYHHLGDYQQALPWFKKCFLIQQDIDDKAGEGTTLNNISQIYKARGDYNTALDYLQQSLNIRQDIGDKKGESVTLCNIANIRKATGDFKGALDYYHKDLKICQDIGDKAGEGTTLNNISAIHHANGDYNTALDYLQQSLNIRQDIGDKAGEGTTLNNISQIYKARGDYNTALDYLQQSLNIRQDIGDKKGESVTLCNIANIRKATGDFKGALDYYHKDLKICQDIGDKAGEGTTLNNISAIHHANGDYNTALDYLQQSLNIRQDIGDKAGEGTTLNNISAIHHANGDYNTALGYLQQSLNIRQDIGDKAGLCATQFNMGHIHWQNDEKSEAMGCWLSVYAMAKPMNLAQLLNALEKLAPQLGLEEGLDGWERLYQQQMAQQHEQSSDSNQHKDDQ